MPATLLPWALVLFICWGVLYRPVMAFPSPSSTANANAKPPVRSIGQAIQDAHTFPQLLNVATDMWLPTDPNLAPHLASQRVHHDKRQRWASQLLSKLSLLLSSSTFDQLKNVQKDTTTEFIDSATFERAILAAALPFQDHDDLPQKEGKHIADSIKAIHAILGRCQQSTGSIEALSLSSTAVDGISILIQRAVSLVDDLTLKEVCELRWAIQGIQAAQQQQQHSDHVNKNILHVDITPLHDRTSKLPFDIIPSAISWVDLCSTNDDDAITVLRNSIPFSKDTIVTRSGKVVRERRGTAWLAQDGIGALAYSGKLMQPEPIPTIVDAAMRDSEGQLGLSTGFFDCALCNHYPDGDSACKFHTDPEHGSHWDRTTIVVAAGEDRKFAFRPIPQMTHWNTWESPATDDATDENLAAVAHLFAGDMVVMKDDCNDLFHHAVHAAELEHSGERVSLVFKRAIDRGGGKRGHGLQGEGRRSRRKFSQSAAPSKGSRGSRKKTRSSSKSRINVDRS